MNYCCIPLGPIWTNSYLVDDDNGKAVCFDVGGDPGEITARLKLDKTQLAAIILTHGHWDHILGLAALKEATGAEVYVPELDEPKLSDINVNLAQMFGYDVAPVKAEHIVRDGDEFSIGGLSITAIHTPGHTQGSTSYIVRQNGKSILVSGDTLFARSIGRTDLPGGDGRAIMRSLARLAAIPGDMPVLPGHGPETSLDVERRLNPFM